MIAQSLPLGVAAQFRYLYTPDDIHSTSLQSHINVVPYRFHLNVEGIVSTIITIPHTSDVHMNTDPVPHSLPWNVIVEQKADTLPMNLYLAIFYLRLTLEDISTGWNRCLSSFDKALILAVKAKSYKPSPNKIL